MNDNEFNPYGILGVDKSDSLDDIKKTYKAKSKELHPDHGGNAEDFANLKKALDILTDPARRSLYDEYGIDEALVIENEAQLVAVQIVISALEGLPDSCDIDKEISAIFKKCLNGLRNQEEAAKKSRDKLQSRLDGIQKKPVDDFLTLEIEKVIKQHNRTMKQVRLNYRIHEMAFKLVQDYQFDITKIPFMEDTDSSKSRWTSRIQNNKDLYRSLGMWVSPGD
jgi:DnaJ-class molecular chaperone